MTPAEEFIKYTNKYKKYGFMMNLKINHTFRVEKLCERIAISENLNKEDVELAKLIGLLHDIGRFEQWRIYKDDFDPKTVDHAKYGVEVLKENNFIKKFTNNNPDTLYKAIKYHNKYKVPNTLSDRNKLFANIIRDADKIDIFNLFIIKELTPKTNNSKISDKVYKSLLDKEAINIKDMKTKADDLALKIGFIFDLNFKESYRILKETNYLNDVIDIHIKETENEELKKQLKVLKDFTNNYIEERITC